ncbi:type II toxin-antitoxin system HicB family antitoxin [Litorivivens sp.]|uniref:type II toxin-antitoxin system HicB family antitoxin n=1 Tax=Litorivivens sp. TaxID=2020868 RepID=UPI0035690079
MTNVMKYKGYIGSIEASPEDGVLFGKLLYIQPLITYEGETVPELKKAFEESVECYLADCMEEGIAPEKPCKGSFNVRVGHDMHLAAVEAAGREDKSLNDLVRSALEAYLAKSRTSTSAR